MINKKRVIFYLPYLIIAIFYALFHMKYMPEYIDDAWTLSWAYRLINFNDVTDHVFGYVNTRGSILFGRGYSYFYGFILYLVGWSRSNAVLISTALTWLTALIWFKTIIRLGYQKRVAHITSILFLIMEIYFALGNKLRSDSLALCLISTAFYLFVSRKYFIAGLLSIIAFEIHGISLTLYFYILAYLVSIFDDLKKRPLFYVKGATLFIIGAIIGLAYYFFLQGEYLGHFFEKTTSELVGHTFYAYFWRMKFAWRHLPEAAMTILAIIIFIKMKLYKKDKFILPFFICCIISSFVFKRGNYHYVAFIYPSVLLLLAYVTVNIKKEKFFWILLLLYLVPQYGFLYLKNHNYDQNTYEDKVLSSIPDNEQFIMGNSGAWFALKDREYHEYGYFKRQNLGFDEMPKSFYLISTEDYRNNIGGYKEYNDKFFKSYNSSNIGSFITYDNKSVEIFLMTKEDE